LRQQFNSKRYNIVSKDLSSHCLAAPAAGWSEHPRSEGGTRSPLRVAKIQAAKPQLFGIVWRSSRSTFKNGLPEEFRAVRDLIGRKVKTLLATLD
jgi:hypothetical protein